MLTPHCQHQDLTCFDRFQESVAAKLGWRNVLRIWEEKQRKKMIGILMLYISRCTGTCRVSYLHVLPGIFVCVWPL